MPDVEFVSTDIGDRFLDLAEEICEGSALDQQLVQQFALIGKATSVMGVAAWLKRTLRTRFSLSCKAVLLDAFGRAFSGDEVGVPGVDILEGVLSKLPWDRDLETFDKQEQLRALGRAAFTCLDHWLEDSDGDVESDPLLQLCVRVLDREDFDDELRQELQVLFDTYTGSDAEENLVGDCPACGHGDVEPDANEEFSCTYCGESWEEHPELPEEGAWASFLGAREWDVKLQMRVPRARVPEWLERMLGIHQYLSLAILESLDIQQLCVGAQDLELLLMDELASSGKRVMCGLRNGRGFTIEATATDQYLIFGYC